jgi:hypothetical protein
MLSQESRSIQAFSAHSQASKGVKSDNLLEQHMKASTSHFTGEFRPFHVYHSFESPDQSQYLVLHGSDDKEPPLAQLHSPFQATNIAKSAPDSCECVEMPWRQSHIQASLCLIFAHSSRIRSPEARDSRGSCVTKIAQ